MYPNSSCLPVCSWKKHHVAIADFNIVVIMKINDQNFFLCECQREMQPCMVCLCCVAILLTGNTDYLSLAIRLDQTLDTVVRQSKSSVGTKSIPVPAQYLQFLTLNLYPVTWSILNDDSQARDTTAACVDITTILTPSGLRTF